VIDRRTFLLGAAALLAGVPNYLRAQPRLCSIEFLSPGIELTYESVVLLRQILPRVQRVGLMHNPDSPTEPLQVRQSLRLAEKIGVRFLPVGVRRGDEVEPAFGTLSAEDADAVIVPASFSFASFHGRIVEAAAASRLPALYGAPGFAEAGGLVSVSPHRSDQLRRAATYVARILKGARPAEMPVDQPTDFAMIVNLKTARTLGITIPKSVLLRADEVIQ
jgi:putative ABC transport system substrate-binding protein